MDILDIGAALKKSVAANQGAENFGKILAVGEDGKVVPVNGSGAEVITADDVLYSGSTTYDDGTVGETLQETAADVSQLKSDFANMEGALANKANVDGSYSSMTVGNAEQLVATVAVEDSVPYNFRTSGGTADIGDREVDKIVGGTVAWNQLVGDRTISDTTINGITWTNNNDGTFTANGTATGDSYIDVAEILPGLQNHIILISGCPAGGGITTWEVFQPYVTHSITCDTGNGRVSKSTSANATCRLYVFSGATADNIKFVPQLFDLTQMFGSTIADYIYNLEQATAGAGVAWFRKLFPKPYYAYNPGELMSVQAAAHRMVGFNAFDGGLENGDINETTGQNSGTSSSRTRCVNYIPVVPGATYYFHTPGHSGNFGLFYYDADKNYINFNSVPSNAAVQIRADTHYIRFRFGAGRIPEDSYVCINLSWDGERDGEYEPYAEHTYPLDDALTLRGIPRLDSGNGLYYDGDTYESDGTVTRRYGVELFNGTEAWGATTNNNGIYCFRKSLAAKAKGANVIDIARSNKLQPKNYSYASASVYNGTFSFDSAFSMIYIIPPVEITTAADFKAWLAANPVTIVYELNTPTTETADPYQSPQIVDDFGTEEYVDAAVAAETRAVAVPVGHSTFYQANLRAKLEMAPDSPDGDGDYIVRQTNGQNAYVPLMKELPTAPTTEGTYHLKATVTSGGVTLTWEADT